MRPSTRLLTVSSTITIWFAACGPSERDFASRSGDGDLGGAEGDGDLGGAAAGGSSMGGTDAMVDGLCPKGQFLPSAEGECQVWTPCPAGEFVSTKGSDTADQSCKGCPAETFTSEPNQPSCSAWRDCEDWEIFSASGTKTSDTVCVPGPWTRQLGSAGEDWAKAMALDQNGDVFLAGFTFGSFVAAGNQGGSDAYLMKLSGNDGSTIWVKQWGTAGSDAFNDLRIAPNGDAIVVGSTSGDLAEGATGTDSVDAYIARVSGETGELLWDLQHDAGLDERLYAVDLTPDGNILLGGRGDDVGTNSNGVGLYGVVSLTEKSVLWAIPIPSDQSTAILDVAIDLNGDYLLCGETKSDLDGEANPSSDTSGRSGFVRKVDHADKTQIWTTFIGSDLNDGILGMDLDSQGNVLVTGYTEGALEDGLSSAYGNQDVVVAKLAGETGAVEWISQTGGVEYERGGSIALPPDNAGLIAVGYTSSALPDTTAADTQDGFAWSLNPDTGQSIDPVRLITSGADEFTDVTITSNALFYFGETDGALANQKNFGDKDLIVFKYIR